MFNFFKIQQAYKNMQASCLSGMASSFLLDENCIQNIFTGLDKNNSQSFLHYLQSRVVNHDVIAFEAYAFLMPEQFIGMSHIAENDALNQRFDAIHADSKEVSSIDETLMKLNAENILLGTSSESVQLFSMLDACCYSTH